ncbi:MAG TPA: hypothetical protein VE525_18760 [Rubrobacter sp.]|jgi:hypothetical protein|nr:hypothetical protein [Rubrobacter sp.]
MSLSFTATGATKYVPGPYQGQLVKIEQKHKFIENEAGEREDRPYLRWIFEILDEGCEGNTLSVLSSTSFGVGPAGPAKARRYAEAILGRELSIGENFNAEDLYDKPVTLHVDNEKTGRGTFAKIVEITPAKAPL